jgi:hypothetical protein
VSTNPWKITATFQTVSSTREEYLSLIDDLKASAPGELKKGEKRSKLEQVHVTLITTLEGRMEVIDAELAVSLSSKTHLGCTNYNLSSAAPLDNTIIRLKPMLTHLYVTESAESKEENRATPASVCTG